MWREVWKLAMGEKCLTSVHKPSPKARDRDSGDSVMHNHLHPVLAIWNNINCLYLRLAVKLWFIYLNHCPRAMGDCSNFVEHTSLSHWYMSHALCSLVSAWSTKSVIIPNNLHQACQCCTRRLQQGGGSNCHTACLGQRVPPTNTEIHYLN